MNKTTKKSLLKAAIQIIYNCAEYTPSNVKRSDLNAKIAEVNLKILEIIKSL